jgi:hypothetical protein
VCPIENLEPIARGDKKVRTKVGNKRRSGTFTVSPGKEVHGELTIDGAKTLLYLRDEQHFSTIDINGRTVKGVLHDLTRVSLIGCLAPPEASHTGRNMEETGSGFAQYYHANIFPHFVVSGDGHLDDEEATIGTVHFLLDDASVLFHDHDAFGWIFEGAPFIDQLVTANNPSRQIATGPDAQIMYFAGKREIFSAETALGTVSAWHNLSRVSVGTQGVRMKARVPVSVAFFP